MKVACLGRVSAIAEYMDKKDGRMVRKASIASGDQMLQIVLPEDSIIEEDDSVMISGELKMFERRLYMEAAKVRLSTTEDRLFLDITPKVKAAQLPRYGEPEHVAPDPTIPQGKGKA